MRTDGRANNQLREITLTPHYLAHAEGSCLVTVGNTHVICTASICERVPPFLRASGTGWVTAEYGMLPRATHTRTDREASRGKQSGRTQEIQRLIGRSLRAVVDLKILGERQIKIDCDAIKADGGTRTASITGSYVALHLACRYLVDTKQIKTLPLKDSVAAISCGTLNNEPLLDLNYEEDRNAETDANFVMTGRGKLIEVQATAEAGPFSEEVFMAMLKHAGNGIKTITQKQLTVLMGESSAT